MAVLPDDSMKRRSQVSRSSWGEDEEGRDEDESWGSYHWDEKDGNTTHTAVGECKGGRAVQADGVKAPRPALVMSRRKGEGSGVEEGVVVDRHPDARCLIPASVAQRCERDTEKCQSCHETLSRETITYQAVHITAICAACVVVHCTCCFIVHVMCCRKGHESYS